GNALQHLRAAGDEIDAGALGQVAHVFGDEHLTGLGFAEKPGGNRDPETGDVVATRLDLADMRARPDADAERPQLVAGRERGTNRAYGRLEDREYSVAGRLDEPALPRADHIAHDPVVPVE